VPSVTRKAKSKREERREELRESLLTAVERMVASGESFTELSVERLVQEAGLSRSTFYVYFEDKGDLVRAWFSQIIEELREAAAPWWSLDESATRDDVREVLARIVTTYRPHTTLMAAVYDTASYDTLVGEEVAEMMGNNIASLRSHIRRGQKAGWVAPDLLPNETASWLMWMAERGQHQLVRAAPPAELERLIDAFTDVVWNTLYASAPSRAG
jgi:AcrR family transcriptional regulator